jgi:DNA-binding transcriptional regulator YhcF (GntR family)
MESVMADAKAIRTNIQSQQSAACNARHMIEARMCRWLLRMRDLADSDNLLPTQEFLAQMLGVQRASVSIVASALRKAGLIKYQRGRIRILNVKGLRNGSCECYATVKAAWTDELAASISRRQHLSKRTLRRRG